MQVYYATMYFVDPATICSTGRTAEEFAAQGSGYMLAMQNGPDASPENLMIAPQNYEEATASVSAFIYTFSLSFIQFCCLCMLYST